MFLKKPVIAARSGGIPEIVEEGVTGLLFDPFDVEALAEAMRRLLEEEGLAQRFGEAGFRRHLEHFRMDSCTRSYLEAYERLFQKEPYS
jgi:glycosyltransferase involved in cell wall biosynthesis